MIEKTFEEIQLEDVERLVQEQICESDKLEYKEAFDDRDERGNKNRLLISVTALANASGGDIIVGISESDGNSRKSGYPVKIVGVECENPENKKLSLLQQLESNIELPLTINAVRIKAISVGDNRYIFIIRVLRSSKRLHRSKNTGHFYMRESGKNRQLSLEEIRGEFVTSNDKRQEMKDFCSKRMENIQKCQKTPIPLTKSAKVILVLIPTDEICDNLDITYYQEQVRPCELVPLDDRSACSMCPKVNFDGVVIYCIYDDESSENQSYIQLYRRGIIELVNGTYIPKKGICPRYEDGLVEGLLNCQKVFKHLDVKCPIYLYLAFVNVKGCKMRINAFWEGKNSGTIDDDCLVIFDEEVENFSFMDKAGMRSKLQSAFNLVRNACGLPVIKQ